MAAKVNSVPQGVLNDRIAIVTGAGQGIGRGISLQLAQQGCHVTIADNVTEKAQGVAKEIEALGRKALILRIDVQKAEDAEQMVSETIRTFGRLDILVNNAGIIRVAPITDLMEEDWDAVINTNLRGAFLCSRAAARVMVKQRGGNIVNISSKSGKKGGLWLGAYCASKFGIIGLTQSMALDLAPFGIRVNAVCPGIVFTEMWEHVEAPYAKKLGISPEEVRARYVEKIPLGRECAIEDIANTVVFLASDKASYITGQAIILAGGQEMS